MTDPIDRATPSAQDDIRFVLQQTLFQQVQALRKFTTTDTLQLQIPDTDVFVFAGPRASVVDFIQRELAQPAASFAPAAAEQPMTGDLTDEEIFSETQYIFPEKFALNGVTDWEQYDVAIARAAIELHIARQSQAGVQAVPAAWMRSNRKECTTAESKSWMENAGFGHWPSIAKEYTIPLYAAPVAQEPMPAIAAPELQQQISDLAASRDGYKSQLEHLTSQPVTLTLTGNQLREALGLINPDGPENEDQCNDELTFGVRQHRDDDGKVETGMCCWNDDMDGEVFPLPDEYAAPAAHAIAARVVPGNLTLSLSREDWGVIFDGVMLDIERSEKRKAVNSESNSDARADQGRAILAAIRSASGIAAPAAQEAGGNP